MIRRIKAVRWRPCCVRHPSLLLFLSVGFMLGIPGRAVEARTQTGPVYARILAQSGWTVVLSDNFDDPNNGKLPNSSPDPAHYELGYVNGEYRIAKVDPNFHNAPGASVPGTYDDAMISVDVRLVGGTPNRYVALVCRRQPDGSQYRLTIDPDAGAVQLRRFDGGEGTDLLIAAPSDAVHRDNQSNHLDLQCVGDIISAFVNNVQVVSVQDRFYRGGSWAILASNYANTDLIDDARFDNLFIYRPAAP